MARLILRRILSAIPTLLVGTTLVFLVLRVLPGDVAELLLTGNQPISMVTPWTADQLRHELGLDKPLYIQYLHQVRDVFTGSFGVSLRTGRSILSELRVRLPVTLELALLAEAVALLIGIPLGVLASVHHDRLLDRLVVLLSTLFLTLPPFWLGLLVILVGVQGFHKMPPVVFVPLWESPGHHLLQMLWPVLILGLQEQARITRMTRSTMLDVLREDYVRTAWAKGLASRQVLFRHALRNSLIPVVTFSSVFFASLLGGAVVLEYIFSLPGLGSWFVDSLVFRDLSVIQALMFILVGFFIIINLMVDCLYGWLDPRIRAT